MKTYNRRDFIIRVAAGTAALAVVGNVAAEEKKGILPADDAYAKAMGFVLNTENVDQAKYPKHTAEQRCSECQLFSGEPGEALGPCSFFGGRLVPVDGWCRNFKPKGAA